MGHDSPSRSSGMAARLGYKQLPDMGHVATSQGLVTLCSVSTVLNSDRHIQQRPFSFQMDRTEYSTQQCDSVHCLQRPCRASSAWWARGPGPSPCPASQQEHYSESGCSKPSSRHGPICTVDGQSCSICPEGGRSHKHSASLGRSWLLPPTLWELPCGAGVTSTGEGEGSTPSCSWLNITLAYCSLGS